MMTYCASNKRVDPLSMYVYLGLRSGVRKDISIAEFSEGQLAIVAVGAEVLEAMQGLAETTEGLAEVVLVAFSIGAAGIQPAIVDAACEAEPEIAGAGSPPTRLVGDVVLHACASIYLDLDGIDGTS